MFSCLTWQSGVQYSSAPERWPARVRSRALYSCYVPKDWCFWTVVLEKTLESPLDCKDIQPVHPRGNQSWIFIGGTDAEAETPVLWPPDAKNWLIGKDPDAGKDWGQEEKGTTEDEIVGWHHRLNGHESELALGVGVGQGSMVCCSSWGHRELDITEWLNWTELNWTCCLQFTTRRQVYKEFILQVVCHLLNWFWVLSQNMRHKKFYFLPCTNSVGCCPDFCTLKSTLLTISASRIICH